MSKRCVIGIDLGGTKILTATADPKGKILSLVKVDTEAQKGPNKVISNIIRSVEIALTKAKLKISNVKNICIGAPGPIIFKKGIVVCPPNLPGWGKVNLRSKLEEAFKRSVILDNDANLAGLAEAKIGAGKGKDNVIYMTISTGIGGGIIINGHIYRGSIGGAGEIGHTIIKKNGPKCGCGKNGCLEAMGSGTAIARMAKEEALESSLILKLAGGIRSKINAEAVSKAAKRGDKLAKKIINEAGENIGIGVANFVNIFNPDVVAIGGGLSEMKDLIFNPIRKGYKKHVLSVPSMGVKISKAKLGTKAGVIGAILCAIES